MKHIYIYYLIKLFPDLILSKTINTQSLIILTFNNISYFVSLFLHYIHLLYIIHMRQKFMFICKLKNLSWYYIFRFKNKLSSVIILNWLDT